MRQDPVPEATWIARSRAGDGDAWRALYDQHFPRVCRLAMRMGVSPRDLPDLCQEVFLRMHRHLPSFRGDAALGTWLFRITMNEVSRLHRQSAVRRALGLWLSREPDPVAPPRPDAVMERTEAWQTLLQVLDGMKPKQRAAFVLFELEELSLDEIADVLGCPIETVKSRLRHARADFDRLRRRQDLVKEGVAR